MAEIAQRPKRPAMLKSGLFGEIPFRAADISKCGRFRWQLTRRWAEGEKVCWVMLNPSTADALQDDPTVRRIIGFTKTWGYGALEVVNLYPFRSAYPADLWKWADWERNGPDWYARDAIMANVDRVGAVAKSCDLVMAGWGAEARDMIFVEHVIEQIESGEEPWPKLHCLGTTKSGAPRHPLYMRGDAKPSLLRPEGA